MSDCFHREALIAHASLPARWTRAGNPSAEPAARGLEVVSGLRLPWHCVVLGTERWLRELARRIDSARERGPVVRTEVALLNDVAHAARELTTRLGPPPCLVVVVRRDLLRYLRMVTRDFGVLAQAEREGVVAVALGETAPLL